MPRNVIRLDASTVDGGFVDGGARLNPLCGDGFCGGRAPDDPGACADVREIGAEAGISPPGHDGGPAPGGQDASADAASGAQIPFEGGAGRDASFERDASVLIDAGADTSDASDAASPSPAHEVDASRDASGVETAPQSLSCQVRSDDYGDPVHQCVPAGLGGVSSECNVAHDCAPGLACVTQRPGEGVCLPYCCNTRTACGAGTFCTERALIDESGLRVPVCAPAEGCVLLAPDPCTGGACCASGTVCSVVLGNGTTGCVTPGAGRSGDACPCAGGYLCSASTSTCVKICKTAGDDTSCTPGRCQATAGFPDGYGLCVGFAPTSR